MYLHVLGKFALIGTGILRLGYCLLLSGSLYAGLLQGKLLQT